LFQASRRCGWFARAGHDAVAMMATAMLAIDGNRARSFGDPPCAWAACSRFDAPDLSAIGTWP
jgi:hypothetical protein